MKFKQIKILFLISILTLFFSIVIFFVKSFYFESSDFINQNIEDNYIEVSSLNSAHKSLYETIESEKSPIYVEKEEEKLRYVYLPNSFKKEAEDYKKVVDDFLNYETISKNIDFLEFYLYKDKYDVRWKMKNKKLHLFWVLKLTKTEFLAVSIHEFWHFLDLYILKKWVYTDLSEYFYAISWNSTKVLKPAQKQKDFVSGYAMTNKYEDFAESFTYYILHNRDFLEKTKSSKILKRKYDFFSKYIFRNSEFKDYDDKKIKKTKNYYWDVTKIDFDLYLFLDYLRK